MNAINGWKKDHHGLSATLNTLESALRMGEEARWVLREVCFSVLKQLRDHARGEEEWIMACRRRLPLIASEEWRWRIAEHREAQQRLSVVTHLLWGGHRVSVSEAYPDMTRVIRAIRHQILEQEARLFPFIELIAAPVWGLQRLESLSGRTFLPNRAHPTAGNGMRKAPNPA